MTKEEYRKLLNSEYWKGFSYSLIKERNFTCEDCGRQFINERNKLQVHHLVYRDVNPWSYKPEEMVVLCKECHEKRHGIYKPQQNVASSSRTSASDNGGYTKTYTSYREPEKASDVDNGGYENRPNYLKAAWAFLKENKKGVLALIFLLIVIVLVIPKIDRIGRQETKGQEEKIETAPFDVKPSSMTSEHRKVKRTQDEMDAEKDDFEEINVDDNEVEAQKNEPINVEQIETSSVKAETTTPQKKKEKSTSELLDERIHNNVVKQAERAGVSTEGSTSDILDRITHANVVKQAKRAGVSTEGSTSDILDRITHANVVKQAKRAGVSTEGSTSDILERITRKNLEK